MRVYVNKKLLNNKQIYLPKNLVFMRKKSKRHRPIL